MNDVEATFSAATIKRNFHSFAFVLRTFPSEMISLAAVAFPFFISSISFLQSASGYQLQPGSFGSVSSPLLPLLYEGGLPLSLSFIPGVILGGINLLCQYLSGRLLLRISMAISVTVSVSLIASFTFFGDIFGTTYAYGVFALNLLVLPFTQITLLNRYNDAGKLDVYEGLADDGFKMKEGSGSANSATADGAQSSGKNVRNRIAGTAMIATADDVIDRIDTLFESEKLMTDLTAEEDAASSDRIMKDETLEDKKQKRLDNYRKKNETRMVNCWACGSRTPAAEERCKFCGFSLKT